MTEAIETGLNLRLLDYERRPDFPVDCLGFTAEANAGSFHGKTTFSVYRRDLEAFLNEVDAMVSTLSGEARMRAGWGEQAHFDFAANYIGRRGQIAVELELADRGPRERMRRLLVDFRTEPELLRRFATGLRRAAKSGDTGPIHLAADDA